MSMLVRCYATRKCTIQYPTNPTFCSPCESACGKSMDMGIWYTMNFYWIFLRYKWMKNIKFSFAHKVFFAVLESFLQYHWNFENYMLSMKPNVASGWWCSLFRKKRYLFWVERLHENKSGMWKSIYVPSSCFHCCYMNETKRCRDQRCLVVDSWPKMHELFELVKTGWKRVGGLWMTTMRKRFRICLFEEKWRGDMIASLKFVTIWLQSKLTEQ